MVENVEETVKKNQKDLLTTTQLRVLLSNAVVVKNKISMENKEEKLSEKIQSEIKYLLVKHIYQCGREKKVKEFDNIFKVSEELKKIGDSKDKFEKFYRYLEEIVAYVKYYKE